MACRSCRSNTTSFGSIDSTGRGRLGREPHHDRPEPVVERLLRYLPTSSWNRRLKSAFAVSMNTPFVPPAPMATVQSPPEYAHPCWGDQFMPLIWVKAPPSVSKSMETVAQNWALI